ncbi:unnamed protein product [Brassica oleracea var. botrytis]|uniref:Uncharacterized protein n=1 Tax=Brassica oleracea TaxID=3712 RepID=A0A3P6FE26_BRAOL|nr:unnamed protein product [Brassica oleracea]
MDLTLDGQFLPYTSFTKNSPTQASSKTTTSPNTSQTLSPNQDPITNMTPTSSLVTQSSPAKHNLPSNHHTPNHAQPTHDILISSAPPRLYPANQSVQLISAKPNRINQVRKLGLIKTPSQLGFIAHASTVNAFASQATSNTPPRSSTSVQEHSESLLEATSELVYVSDSSPSKPLPELVPSGPEEELALLLINSPPVPATLLFAPIDP